MKKVIGSVAVSLGLALSASAWAADYPTKSIDVVVPSSAGGGNDTFIRALQPLLEEQFGENLVIRNIAGGGGAVGMTRVAALEPDGYTVLAASNAMLTLEAMGSVSFTRDDFDFIAKVIEEPYVIAVSGDSQYQDLEGLIDAAASGETVQIGVSGIGSSAHIAAVAMANSAGVELNIVPYPGGSETISAVMGGHIEGLVLGGAELRSALQSGRLNALAITYDERSASLPEVPTFQEKGYDLTLTVWRGIAAPKGLPPEVAERWVAALEQIVADGSYEETAANLGTELAPLYGEELAAFIEDSAEVMRDAAGDLARE